MLAKQSKNLRRIIFLLPFFLLALAVAGCSSNPGAGDSAAIGGRVKSRKIKQPAAEERDKDVFGLQADRFEYTYNPIGKKDPFRIDVERGEERLPGNSKLLQYNIDQLRITAIIWGIAKPKALIQAPDGESFIVSKGDLVGRNYGKINRILKEEVIVIEEYPGPLGKLIVNEIVMPLIPPGEDQGVLELR